MRSALLDPQQNQYLTAFFGDGEWELKRLATDRPARVRGYLLEELRDADAMRPIEEKEPENSGLIFEMVISDDPIDFKPIPVVYESCFINLTNISDYPGEINLTLYYDQYASDFD
ncbi:hypothetical protein IQ258_28950 [Coleofasciculus sp. LEGE 07081]|uniref:hypothetical protein n=1 Tax=Coleofasciculus sp. LEGE 07081 TaxID=2777967 RepID=UPI001880DA60|nr:hypothetical protein [Coleofasciculus sp. LEGE 07081]MBE9130053.1 hypothetical protein [Coleofasciculus sp. LEGE 07081]